MTKKFNWSNGINKDELGEVIEVLKNDGIVIFPTETVYGIAGNAFSKKAVDKIYKIKNRPKDKALNIMIGTTSDIEKYAIIKSDIERKLIEKYMPGPITIILEKKDCIGEGFTKDDSTIGIRIPNCEIVQAILNEIDFPLIVPSANISGKESGINPTEILKDFDGKVDIFIDGGTLNNTEASTIVKVENEQFVILREGKLKINL